MKLTSVKHSELCQSFKELAKWVWLKMDSANRHNVSFNEETITESLLLKLAERHSGKGLKIEAYSKAEEGNKATGNGADWSFWIGNPTGWGKELRIQAKRQFTSGKYESLDGRRGNNAQIDKLWENSTRSNAIPLYVFYNGHFSQLFLSWPLSALDLTQAVSPKVLLIVHHLVPGPIQAILGHLAGESHQKEWGCSYAPLRGIPSKHQPTPSDIPSMRPWHHLVCGYPAVFNAKDSLADRMVAVLEAAYKNAETLSDPEDKLEDADNISFELTNTAPAWVELLNVRESKDGDSSYESNEKLDRYLAKQGLKGVVLIQEVAGK